MQSGVELIQSWSFCRVCVGQSVSESLKTTNCVKYYEGGEQNEKTESNMEQG